MMDRRKFLTTALASAALPAIAPTSAWASQSGLPDPVYQRQLVAFADPRYSGRVVIDTNNRFLYVVRGDGTAIRYGVGVGRDGYRWQGVASVGRKDEWPAWHPPAEMRERQPYLPSRMEGGPNNPLGARALYLYDSQGADTLYRIHGTNEPHTIGMAVSSGCIRLVNEDVMDLYRRVPIGTKVVVLAPDASIVTS